MMSVQPTETTRNKVTFWASIVTTITTVAATGIALPLLSWMLMQIIDQGRRISIIESTAYTQKDAKDQRNDIVKEFLTELRATTAELKVSNQAELRIATDQIREIVRDEITKQWRQQAQP